MGQEQQIYGRRFQLNHLNTRGVVEVWDTIHKYGLDEWVVVPDEDAGSVEVHESRVKDFLARRAELQQ